MVMAGMLMVVYIYIYIYISYQLKKRNIEKII